MTGALIGRVRRTAVCAPTCDWSCFMNPRLSPLIESSRRRQYRLGYAGLSYRVTWGLVSAYE